MKISFNRRLQAEGKAAKRSFGVTRAYSVNEEEMDEEAEEAEEVEELLWKKFCDSNIEKDVLR